MTTSATEELDLDKPLETTNGRKVRIISNAGVEPYVLVGYMDQDDLPSVWTRSGEYAGKFSSNVYDLRNVSPPQAPAPIIRYFNIYPGGVVYQHNSRKEADKAETSEHRLGCQRVELIPGTWDN